jgi:hypothetical protein
MGFLDLEDEVGTQIYLSVPKPLRKFVGIPQTSTHEVIKQLKEQNVGFKHTKDPSQRPFISTNEKYEFICLRVDDHRSWKTRLSNLIRAQRSGCPDCARAVTIKNLTKPKPPPE